MALSPFTTILRQYAESNDLRTQTQEKVRKILQSTTRNKYIVSQLVSPSSWAQTPLDALVLSLRCFGSSPSSDAIYRFLDNCVCRLARKPIKYESDRIEFNVAKDREPASLLVVVYAEQWQHLFKSASTRELEDNASWTILLLKMLLDIGEDRPTIQHVFERIKDSTPDHKAHLFIHNDLQSPISICGEYQQLIEAYFKALQPKQISNGTLDKVVLQAQRIDSQILGCKPPNEVRDHPELHSWARKDPQDAIDDGTLGKLIMCLCSTYGEVRRQALNSMRRFMSTLKVFSSWQDRPRLLMSNRVLGTANGSLCSSYSARLSSLPKIPFSKTHFPTSLESLGRTCCKYWLIHFTSCTPKSINS